LSPGSRFARSSVAGDGDRYRTGFAGDGGDRYREIRPGTATATEELRRRDGAGATLFLTSERRSTNSSAGQGGAAPFRASNVKFSADVVAGHQEVSVSRPVYPWPGCSAGEKVAQRLGHLASVHDQVSAMHPVSRERLPVALALARSSSWCGKMLSTPPVWSRRIRPGIHAHGRTLDVPTGRPLPTATPMPRPVLFVHPSRARNREVLFSYFVLDHRAPGAGPPCRGAPTLRSGKRGDLK